MNGEWGDDFLVIYRLALTRLPRAIRRFNVRLCAQFQLFEEGTQRLFKPSHCANNPILKSRPLFFWRTIATAGLSKAMQVFHKSGMQLANAFTVILVYQDEHVRQEKIEYVRKSFPYADLKNLDNLKFATFRFELLPVWVDDVLTRKWVISGMAYFKPASCEPMESRMPASSQGYLEATIINGHNGIAGYTPLLRLPDGWPHNPPLSPPANSMLAKTLDVMRQQLKSYGLPN
jgi:hypothetical protein